MAKKLTGYDWDGVASEGVFTKGSIIITGEPESENESILEALGENKPSKIYNYPHDDLEVESATQFKLKDEFGKTYSFFKSKKDGSPTQAMVQFGEYKVGERTGISYKQVPYTLPDGKQTMLNNLLGFMPTIQESAPETIQNPKPHTVPSPKYEATEPKNDTFWDKKAYKQCLWNYWLENGNPAKGAYNNLTKEDCDMVWQVFNQIEADADKRFASPDEIASNLDF